jgi:propanol-preferring alcohol dehydrogenase
MRAMILRALSNFQENPEPLSLVNWPDPMPKAGEILIKVSVCGVCHTELDEIEGRTPPPRLPIIPGHQVIGRVESLGENVTEFKIGDRVGVAWIFSTCGICTFCRSGNENLCSHFLATGRDANGGYAERMTAPSAFAVSIPDGFTDAQAAPLLCAGAVGYRALRLSGLENGQALGLTGFGASAHLVLQMVRYKYPDSIIYVFARDKQERAFARELGATWTGDTTDRSPKILRAIIDTTPAWTPIVRALENLEPGGRLVINAIRKEATDKQTLLQLQYATHLWQEKEIKSVANVTRTDVKEFLALAAQIPLQPEIHEYKLEDANIALFDLKTKHIKGAKILRI